MQFRTILLCYKKCVTEKRTKVTTILIGSNLYLLTVQMTIPFNKLPWLDSFSFPLAEFNKFKSFTICH